MPVPASSNFTQYCAKNKCQQIFSLIFKTLYKHGQIKEQAKEEESMQTFVNQV
jgi:hypothetical protein